MYFCHYIKNNITIDVFERIQHHNGSIGKLQHLIEGDFTFLKLEGKISNHISFKNKELICWSYNNYLGLAGSKEVDEIDAFAQKK